MSGRFGSNPYTAPVQPTTPASGGKFGANPYAKPYDPYDPAAGQVPGSVGALTARPGQAPQQGALFQSALIKLRAHQPLTVQEQAAYDGVQQRQQSMDKQLGYVATALQPLMFFSDVTKGIAESLKTGDNGAADRGVNAAVAHLTYGASEYLPHQQNARAQGVTGADLLKGTKYEGSGTAALVVEVLSDPTIVLTGAGLLAKTAAAAAKLSRLEGIAGTAEGAAQIKGIITAVNTTGSKLIHTADTMTGVPLVARAVVDSPVGRAVKTGLGKLGQVTLPPGQQALTRVRTVGDAAFTPDIRAAVYTPEQQAAQGFRDSRVTATSDLKTSIAVPAQKDISVVTRLTDGLSQTDSRAVLGYLTEAATATDARATAAALQAVRAMGTRLGRDLETPFVSAYKSLANVRLNNLGNKLADAGLPAVVDPVVSKAIEAAQNGDDLVRLTGQLKTADGRPAGILPVQYKGRGGIDAVVADLNAAPPIPASVTLDVPRVAATVEGVARKVEVPALPPAPTGVKPAGAATVPVNTADKAAELTRPAADAAPPTPPPTVPVPAAGPAADGSRPTADVIRDLFGGSTARDVPDAAVPSTRAAETTAEAGRGAGEAEDVAAVPEAKSSVSRMDTTSPGSEAAPAASTTMTAESSATAGANSMADVREALSTAGSSIGNNGRDLLWERYSAGKVDEAGQPSATLQGAAMLRQQGVQLDRATFDSYVNDMQRTIGTARGTPDYQQALSDTVGRYASPPVTPTVRTPQEVLQEVLGRPAEPVPSPAPANTAAQLSSDTAVPLAGSKTPQEVMADLLSPKQTDPLVQPSEAITRTPQADMRSIALPEQPAERLVQRDVPTNYRTVPVDTSALDWSSLPDAAARREVSNAIGDGFALKGNARGGWEANRPAAAIPLDHPVIQRYLPNEAIEQARFGGDAGYGEKTVTSRQTVPNWFDSGSGLPMDVQRAQHEAALSFQISAAYPNDIKALLQHLDSRNDEAFVRWYTGDAYASSVYGSVARGTPPITPSSLIAESNSYSARIVALNGRPPTPAELFQWRLQAARVARAQRLRDVDGTAVSQHLRTFFDANPEGTLYEATLSAAKQFGLGRTGANTIRAALAREESGFLRQMSSLEKKEFAQVIKARQTAQSGRSTPGGMLTSRLLRNPEEVSEQFKQVFPREMNAVKLMVEEVRTRGAAIVQAENFRAYHDFLRETGQHLTFRERTDLMRRPVSQLMPQELALRESIAGATEHSGAPAGWKIMDRNAGAFQVGDAVPWWAYHDLFGAASVQDAAVSARILQNGGLGAWSLFKRANATINANLLSGVTSIVNDQVGLLQQMVLWGVSPGEIAAGMIRRLAAGTNPEGQAMLKAMRAEGLTSAKLESNIAADQTALSDLARRLDGETEGNHLQRILDGVVRFREYGSGINRGALTNPVARGAANVAMLGSGYLFELRSALADFQRESLYFHYLSEERTPAQAAAETNQVLMDMRLAPAYARVVSHFWSFFRWTAMAAPRSVITFFRRPAISYTYQQLPRLSDRERQQDPTTQMQRILSTDAGYLNTGWTERDGTGVYLDTRSWDIENTIPQLFDFSGTKVGSVGLPWLAQLITGAGWGVDRNGNQVYSQVLGGRPGNFQAAFALNPQQASITAAKYVWSIFSPSYSPGSPRAQALVSSIQETAQLPNDGSRDISLAHLFTGTEWGRAALRYMQQGAVGMAAQQPLTGRPESQYSKGAPSMARAGLSFVLPFRGVNADPNVQGDALQRLSLGDLTLQNWMTSARKQYAAAEQGGMSPDRLEQLGQSLSAEYDRRAAVLAQLEDQLTRSSWAH